MNTPDLLQHLAARAEQTLQRALPLLLKHHAAASPLPEHLRQLLQAADLFRGALTRTLQDLPALASPETFPLRLQALQSNLQRAELAAAEADPRRILTALLPALDQAALLAAEQEHPQRARLLLLDAALREIAARVDPPGDPDALRDAWQRALDHAEAAQDLPAFQRAAQRQQAEAIDHHDFQAAAQLAARVRDLAASLQAHDVAHRATLEAASALLLDDAPQPALDLLTEAIPPPSPLRARHRALQGEALLALQRRDDARDVLHHALDLASQDRDDGARGAALLALASLHAEDDPDRALQHLRDACDAAQRAEAWPLYARAALTAAWLLHALDRRPQAVEALIRGRVTLEHALGTEHIQAFLDTADAFAQDWGGDAFIQEVQRFRERMTPPAP